MNAYTGLATQMPGMSWHNGGLFMGMHWLWWGFWIVLLAVLGLAFWRLASDRVQTRRSVTEEEIAEDALRRRFAKGEIGEEEYGRRLKVLRESLLGR
jgi:putative membrane protein